MKVGTKVKHKGRVELGFGTVTAVYDNGHCDVDFDSCKFSWVEADAFVSEETERMYARRSNLCVLVERLIRRGDLSAADQLYETECSEWWPRSEYQPIRSAAEAAFLHAERERKRREERAVVIDQLRSTLATRYITADSLYQERFSEVIPESEYLALKHGFVRSWLQDNLPIASDQFPDDEQIAAIAAVSGTTQVIARAGSGKTTTLIRRTYFLMRHCKVPPEQILLLAFNRSAVLDVRLKLLAILCPAAEATVANELRAKERAIKKLLDRRVAAVDRAVQIHAVAMPNVMTFHALAYGLVNPVESVLKDSEEDGDFGLSSMVQHVIDDHVRDKAWLPRIRSLMLMHFREDWERIERGGFDLPDRDSLLEYRRSLPRETLQGEYVKSHGEKVIADFLLEHGVPYRYERNHRWNGFNYRPDFTLFRQAGRNASGAIIEYFGLQG